MRYTDSQGRTGPPRHRKPLLKCLNAAHCNEGVVGAESFREGSHAINDIVLSRVDRVCGAELSSKLELCLDDIYGDDWVRAGNCACLHDIQAHSAATRDDGALARLRLSGIEDGADAGQDSAADQRNPIQRHLRVHSDEAARGHDALLGEGRDSGEVVDRATVYAVAGCAIGEKPAWFA